MNIVKGNIDVFNSIKNELQNYLNEHCIKKVDVQDDKEVASWFLGTRGENIEVATEIITGILEKMINARKDIFPSIPNYITDEIKESEAYRNSIESVKEHVDQLVYLLNKYSLPTYSLRYQGHMLWDITLPSLTGYFAAMLQNQNNVTPQASPATTIIELLACNDIAQMAGFKVRTLDNNDDNEICAWTHISCDGSVANIESLWAAREVKFLPLAIRYALNEGEYLEAIQDLLMLNTNQKFIDASIWELLNLSRDEILNLPEKIYSLLKDKVQNLTLSDVWDNIAKRYSLNAKGMQFFNSEYLQKNDIKAPVVIVPSN